MFSLSHSFRMEREACRPISAIDSGGVRRARTKASFNPQGSVHRQSSPFGRLGSSPPSPVACRDHGRPEFINSIQVFENSPIGMELPRCVHQPEISGELNGSGLRKRTCPGDLGYQIIKNLASIPLRSTKDIRPDKLEQDPRVIPQSRNSRLIHSRTPLRRSTFRCTDCTTLPCLKGSFHFYLFPHGKRDDMHTSLRQPVDLLRLTARWLLGQRSPSAAVMV
jgi:hypothetical protein